MEDFIRGRIQEVMPVVIADIVAVYLLDLEPLCVSVERSQGFGKNFGTLSRNPGIKFEIVGI